MLCDDLEVNQTSLPSPSDPPSILSSETSMISNVFTMISEQKHASAPTSAVTYTSEMSSSSHVTTMTPTPTTTVHPTLPPTPSKWKWSVKDDHNNTCILLEAGIRLTFNYVFSTNQSARTGFMLDVPANYMTAANGTCGHAEQNITLSFFETWQLSLNFLENKNTSTYELKEVSLIYEIIPPRFPDATPVHETSMNNSVDMFTTGNNKKFVCVASQKLYENLNLNETSGLVRIETYSLTFEAFRNASDDTFSVNAQRCPQDEVSQLVPIIVGAALGGLILIVLIAYLIGRKRSRRGYESV
jgi:lysosomal-associated membrane protein 1/2